MSRRTVVNGLDAGGGLWFSRRVESEAEFHRALRDARAIPEVTTVKANGGIMGWIDIKAKATGEAISVHLERGLPTAVAINPASDLTTEQIDEALRKRWPLAAVVGSWDSVDCFDHAAVEVADPQSTGDDP